MIWFIIYLVGCVIAAFIDIIKILESRDYEIRDIFESTFLLTVISWVTVIAYIITCIEDSIDGDTVIFKKKG